MGLVTGDADPGCAIEARALSRRFGSRLVLDGVGLRLPPGRLCVALGPNGAGKTTLIRLLSGVLAPDAGSIRLRGEPLESLSRREVARRLSVVPQDLTAAFPYAVEEMVAMGRAPHVGRLGREGPHDRAALDRALEAMGLGPLRHRPFPTLSGGERQRVLIARALAQESDLMILDEPTAHMDLGHRLFVFELVRSWIGERPDVRASLVVTHDLALATAFADRVLLLHGGREAGFGTPAEVLTPERIETVYEADVEVRDGPEGRPIVVALRSRIRYPAAADATHRRA